MTDRTPDDPQLDGELGPDDDGVQDLEVLRGLGFDALGDDVPLDGMDEVRARANSAARRRRWIVGAVAAAVLLVVGSLGVAVARTGEESSPDVYTGPPPVEGQRFLLPPADATDVGWQVGLDAVRANVAELPAIDQINLYVFRYGTPNGPMTLLVGRVGADDGVDTTLAGNEGVLVAGDAVPGGSATNFSTNGSFWVSCARNGGAVSGGAVDETWTFSLGFVEPSTRDDCTTISVAPALKSETVRLRIVGETEWRQYLRDHRDTNTLDPANGPTTTATSTPR